ncbi:MAG TPA: MFS transporter [Opitutaceae bacterium]|nr:MFS transporter [Opitutaceae bacterium]
MTKRSNLIWLALGAFAIGTEGYMVAGLLPTLATDLHVSLSAAGQLIAVFALAYAIGSPLLAVATGRMERRRLLLGSLAAFGALNVVAALAHTYATLLLARVGLALAAGTFVPAASAYAVAVMPAAQRGRALSIIFAGMTVAMMVGVPLGVVLGGHFGWRFTFVGVAFLAVLAWTGLALTLERVPSSVAIPLRERFAIARRPDVFQVLVNTLLALTGVYAIFSFLAPLLARTAGLGSNGVAALLFVFGAAAAIGNLVGGRIVDRIGPKRVLVVIFGALTLVFAALSLVGESMPAAEARWLVIPILGLWGLLGASFPSAQQVRMASLAPRLAPVTLALNASAIYLGASAGAFIGSLVIAYRSPVQLGWVGAAFELLALTQLIGSRRHVAARDETDLTPSPEIQPVIEPI